jgi:hypothetical protein
MNSKYLADTEVQGYLVHKIRLGALSWSNIETSLLESEFLDSSAQLFSSGQIMGLQPDQSHICAPLALGGSWRIDDRWIINLSIMMSHFQTS